MSGFLKSAGHSNEDVLLDLTFFFFFFQWRQDGQIQSTVSTVLFEAQHTQSFGHNGTDFALADLSQRICHDAIANRWKVCGCFIFSDVMDPWIRTALFCRSAGLPCSHRVIPPWLYDIFTLNMNAYNGLQPRRPSDTHVCMSPSCIYSKAAR